MADGQTAKGKSLARVLVRSLSAKALAVRRVTENQGADVNSWLFAARKQGTDGKSKEVRLVQITDTPIRRHVKVKAEANPYDPKWEAYFEVRQQRAMEEGTSGPIGPTLASTERSVSGLLPATHHRDWLERTPSRVEGVGRFRPHR